MNGIEFRSKMEVVNPGGVPVLIVTQSDGLIRRQYASMRSSLAKKLIVLGTMQIVLGIFSIIFQAVNLTLFVFRYHFSFAPVGYGFWIGAIFIITGSFGIVGGIRKNRCSVVTFNVLSIISASFTVIMFILSTIAAHIGLEEYRYYRENRDNGSPYYGKNYNDVETKKTMAIMDALLAALAILEAITAICSCVVCCMIGACCCDCDGDCCCPSTKESPIEAMLMEQNFASFLQQLAIVNKSNQSHVTKADDQLSTINQGVVNYEQLITETGANEDVVPTHNVPSTEQQSSSQEPEKPHVYANTKCEVIVH